MKFPYNLSELRISLLSKEDLAIYNYEHSDYYRYEERELLIKESLYEAKQVNHDYWLSMINETYSDEEINENDKQILADTYSNIELTEDLDIAMEFIRNEMYDVIPESEMDDYEMQLREYVNAIYNEQLEENDTTLNEVAGQDMTACMQGASTLTLSILGAGLSGMILAFVAGKDRSSARKLERHMNRLVEMTDDGINKKRRIFSGWLTRAVDWLKGNGNNTGDQSASSFRDIQELVQRELLKNVLILGKNLGFYGNDAITEAASLNFTGGLFSENGFKGKIADKIESCIK